MNISKIIVVVLGLTIVAGIVFSVLKPNKSTEQANINNPVQDISGKITEVVVKPLDTEAKLSLEFGKSFTLALNKVGTFTDGLNITLKKINDSRCPVGVECVWAGELSAVLELSSSTIISKEVVLGTVRNKEVVSDGYTFSLKDATKESASIVVVKK